MIGSINMYNGYEVYTNLHLTKSKQFRFPKSKRKRIRVKWGKQTKNFRSYPSDEIVVIGNKMIMHPIYYNRLMQTIKERK